MIEVQVAVDDGDDARRFDSCLIERALQVYDRRRVDVVDERVPPADAGVDDDRPVGMIDNKTEYNCASASRGLRVALGEHDVGKMQPLDAGHGDQRHVSSRCVIVGEAS